MQYEILKINGLDGGVLGVSVRGCMRQYNEDAENDCNRCVRARDRCELAFFSSAKHGSGAVDAAKAFVRKINPNGALAKSNR